MSTEQDKILDRVRKLLELAASDNVNEAGNAMAQAQKLMARHSIDSAMVSTATDEPEEDVCKDMLHAPGGRVIPARPGDIAQALSWANQCKVYISRREGLATMNIVGRPSDMKTVRYLFAYLVREIDRLASQEAAERGSPGRTWLNNFRVGAAESVAARIRHAQNEARAEMRKEAGASDTLGSGTALARVNTAIAKVDSKRADVDSWSKQNLNLRTVRRGGARFDPDAKAAGERAGKNIHIGTSKALGGGSKALPQ